MDDKPLLAFLTDTFASFPDGIKRKSMIGTVDANNADYKVWFLDEISPDKVNTDAPKQCISSASLPGLFIPAEIDGGVYIDGGTAMGLDAISAVRRCLETVGDDQEKVTLDIMLLDMFVPPIAHEKIFGDSIASILR